MGRGPLHTAQRETDSKKPNRTKSVSTEFLGPNWTKLDSTELLAGTLQVSAVCAGEAQRNKRKTLRRRESVERRRNLPPASRLLWGPLSPDLSENKTIPNLSKH